MHEKVTEGHYETNQNRFYSYLTLFVFDHFQRSVKWIPFRMLLSRSCILGLAIDFFWHSRLGLCAVRRV